MVPSEGLVGASGESIGAAARAAVSSRPNVAVARVRVGSNTPSQFSSLVPRLRRSAQPYEKPNQQRRWNERPPPRLEAECAERPRTDLYEKHQRAGPGEGADQIQRAEFHWPYA